MAAHGGHRYILRNPLLLEACVVGPAEAPERLLTLEEFEQLPSDGYRYELVRGRLVREPQPTEEHGWLQVRLGAWLSEFVERHRLGLVMGPAGYVLEEEPPTVRGPDLSFVAAARLTGGYPARKFRHAAPDLAVEIVSPSNRASELNEKVVQYLDAGSRMVWVVDPVAATVMCYRSASDVRLLRLGEELDGGEVLPGFRLPLSRLFARP
jgi:Uma2 family endonuclease